MSGEPGNGGNIGGAWIAPVPAVPPDVEAARKVANSVRVYAERMHGFYAGRTPVKAAAASFTVVLAALDAYAVAVRAQAVRQALEKLTWAQAKALVRDMERVAGESETSDELLPRFRGVLTRALEGL